MNTCEHDQLKRSCPYCWLEDDIRELRQERDEYRMALCKMDDRKNAMIPRSEMARIAREVLDKYSDET